MKQIYGFRVKQDEYWGDVFDDERLSPEYLISSACHKYYDMDGNVYIGFDMSLGLSKAEMRRAFGTYCDDPRVSKVL